MFFDAEKYFNIEYTQYFDRLFIHSFMLQIINILSRKIHGIHMRIFNVSICIVLINNITV